MARSSVRRRGRVARLLGYVLILLGLATACGGYLAGAVVAWMAPGCGDAAMATHCGDAGNSVIYAGVGIAVALLVAGAGLIVRGRL